MPPTTDVSGDGFNAVRPVMNEMTAMLDDFRRFIGGLTTAERHNAITTKEQVAVMRMAGIDLTFREIGIAMGRTDAKSVARHLDIALVKIRDVVCREHRCVGDSDAARSVRARRKLETNNINKIGHKHDRQLRQRQ